MKIKYLFLFIVFFSTNIFAQNFDNEIKELSGLMVNAAEENDYVLKQEYVKQFSDLLEKTLKKPNSLYQPFDSIPHMKVIRSNDGMVRIFNWGVPNEKGKYSYYAVVQRRMGDKNSPLSDVFILNDNKENITNPEKEVLQYPDWYGCLYTDIIEKKDVDNRTIYTLLGFDFNNRISHKKYIDILTFNAQGIPSFGVPLFIEGAGGIKTRIIFEYAAQALMHLSYQADQDKIVFSHLFPLVPDKSNDKTFYVPDMAYDGFEFKFDKWMKVKNLKIVKPAFENRPAPTTESEYYKDSINVDQ